MFSTSGVHWNSYTCVLYLPKGHCTTIYTNYDHRNCCAAQPRFTVTFTLHNADIVLTLATGAFICHEVHEIELYCACSLRIGV